MFLCQRMPFLFQSLWYCVGFYLPLPVYLPMYLCFSLLFCLAQHCFHYVAIYLCFITIKYITLSINACFYAATTISLGMLEYHVRLFRGYFPFPSDIPLKRIREPHKASASVYHEHESSIGYLVAGEGYPITLLKYSPSGACIRQHSLSSSDGPWL